MNPKPKCYVCDKPIKKNSVRKLHEAPPEVQEAAKMHRLTHQPPLEPMQIINTVRICQNCLRNASTATGNDGDGEKVEFNVLSQRSRARCCICEHQCNNRISHKARIKVYVESNIFVPEGTRMCFDHYTNDGMYMREEFLQGLSFVKRKINVPILELHKWIVSLRTEVRNTQQKRFHDETEFTEEGFKTFTSLTKEQFNNLFSFCKPVELYHVPNRKISKKDLLMFLAKLRQGLSDDFLCVMFKYSSRQAVSLAVAKVRKSLMLNFVPHNLGVHAITRQEYIDRHVTDFTNELYNPDPDEKVAIIYIDGTYIRVPKISCYRILRQSFCTHKGYHLVKPIMVVAPDGYILDVHGPYFSDGTNNDAACIKNELENDIQGFRSWLQENDIFVVDRGYRDCIEYLETLGIRTEMPAYLRKGCKQHSTEEANKSRLITNTRWIVEARNGHVKSKYKFFGETVDVHHLSNIGDFFRIACALINAYHPLIYMQNATVERARLMLSEAHNAVNVVEQRVLEDRLHLSSGSWFPMQQTHVPGFPKLSLEYLRDITLGIYQLRLAKSYVQDKINQTGEYGFEINLDVPGLLRVRTHSRHVGSGSYKLYIAYAEQNFEESIDEPVLPMPQEEPILGWYCKCKAGARTVGCCAHVASVLWYLGYARFEPRVPFPSHKGLTAIRDAANRPLPEIIDAAVYNNVGANIANDNDLNINIIDANDEHDYVQDLGNNNFDAVEGNLENPIVEDLGNNNLDIVGNNNRIDNVQDSGNNNYDAVDGNIEDRNLDDLGNNNLNVVAGNNEHVNVEDLGNNINNEVQNVLDANMNNIQEEEIESEDEEMDFDEEEGLINDNDLLGVISDNEEET